MSRIAARVVVFSLAAAAPTVQAQGVVFEPAQYRGGTVPILPTTAVGGGEVVLDAAVDARGNVSSVTKLRVSPPFTEMFAGAVRGWSFRPARDMGMPAPSHVLVAVLVRPPALTIPSTHGEPPQDVAAPRAELPDLVALVTPAYPPLAHRSGVVLVEVRIDATGRVTAVRVAQSAPPFDSAASDAAWQCTFRPAMLRGTRVVSLAYIAFGFPEIVTNPH
ncbi:MAG TPA: TonB family protein [Vicinamibacterales bacterium]